MEKCEKRFYKKQYKFYEKELSNFKTIMKDTDNHLVSSHRYDYNCMSYALGIYDEWLYLESFDYSLCNYDIDYDRLEDIFDDCCQELTHEYNLRRLSNLEEKLEPNERIIAFRIGATDFHFVRKNSDGTWTHKAGEDYIYKMSEEELLSSTWSDYREYPYISEIAFFAVKM